MIVYIMVMLSLIGSLATLVYSDPLEKLINLAIAAGGVVGLVATKGYLDVAGTLAVMLPVSTIIIATILIRMEEVEKWR